MKHVTGTDKVQKNLFSEMKRGDIVLAALLMLDSPDYGYGLLKKMQSKGLDISQDTLYPLLRRLESQGLIESDWDTEGSRPRKVYIIREESKSLREEMIEQWKNQKAIMEKLI